MIWAKPIGTQEEFSSTTLDQSHVSIRLLACSSDFSLLLTQQVQPSEPAPQDKPSPLKEEPKLSETIEEPMEVATKPEPKPPPQEKPQTPEKAPSPKPQKPPSVVITQVRSPKSPLSPTNQTRVTRRSESRKKEVEGQVVEEKKEVQQVCMMMLVFVFQLLLSSSWNIFLFLSTGYPEGCLPRPQVCSHSRPAKVSSSEQRGAGGGRSTSQGQEGLQDAI